MPDEHAKLAPSAFSRWGVCPGSIHLSKDLPEQTSDAAQWGTDAHTILENLLLEWRDGIPYEAIDVEDYVKKLEVANTAFEYVVRRMTSATEEGLGPLLMIEEKVYPTEREDLWGSADVIILTRDWIETIDLKGGDGIPVHADSDQLKIYSLGAMNYSQGAWQLGDEDIVAILATIVQPRLPINGEVIRSAGYTADQLIQWRDEVLLPAATAVDAAEQDIKLTPGEHQCRFCLAKATCPALSQKSLDLAMSVFENHDEPLEKLVTAKPEELPLEKLVEIIEAMPMITGWLKSVEKYAVNRLTHHESVPGYKLVRGGQRNKWTLPDDEVLAALTKGKGKINKGILTKQVVLTAPQALKVKGLSETQRERLHSLVGKSEGSLQLVPVTDARPDACPAPQFQDMSFLD